MKKYEIRINGLSESISQMDILTGELDSLEKKLGKLSREKVQIAIDKSALQTQKEIEKSLALSNQEVQKNIQNTEKLKAQNKEIAKINKEIALGIREQSGEYANTLAGQRAYLAELKSSLANMNLDDSGWDALASKVSDVNEKVKELEKSYGVFTRDVGHYENATKGLNEIKTGADDAKAALEAFRSQAKFEVELDGVKTEFDDIGQAISEIDKLAQKASATLMQMKDAGQANTEEYAAMAKQFEMYASKSGELQRAVKYTDQLKDSVASTTYELDTAIRGFQEIGYVLQGATAIAGMFGKDQEEIQKAMNATVQVMGLMQATQELVNSTQQKGSLIMKAYSLSVAGADKAMKAFGISSAAASVGVKVLRTALISTGIGALVVGLGVAVSALMKWIEKLQQGDQTTKAQLESLDKLDSKYQSITKTLNETTELKLMTKMISDLDAANEKLDIAKAKAIAYRVELLKLSKGGQDLGKILSRETFDKLVNVNLDNPKELVNILDNLELEYVQLTQKAKEASEAGDKQAKVWDAQAKSALMLMDVLKEVVKANKDVLKAEEDYAKKSKDASNDLENLKIKNIKNEYKRRQAEIDKQFKDELSKVRERGIKVADLEKQLTIQKNNQLLELDKEYAEKRRALLEESNKSLVESEVELQDAQSQLIFDTYEQKTKFLKTRIERLMGEVGQGIDIPESVDTLLETLDYLDSGVNKQLQVEGDNAWLRENKKQMTDMVNNYKKVIEEMIKANEELKDDPSYKEWAKQFKDLLHIMNGADIESLGFNVIFQDMKKSFKALLADMEDASTIVGDGLYTPLLNAGKEYFNKLETMEVNFQNQQLKSKAEYDRSYIELEAQQFQTIATLYDNILQTINTKINDSIEDMSGDALVDGIAGAFGFGKAQKAVGGDLKYVLDSVKDYISEFQKMRIDLKDEIENINSLIDIAKQAIFSIDDELTGKNIERETAVSNGFSSEIIAGLDKDIAKLEAKKAEFIEIINSLFKQGEISSGKLININATLQDLEKVKKESEETSKQLRKDLIDNIANAAMEIVNAFNSLYSGIAEMQYANEMDRLDKLQKSLDDELEMIQSQAEEKAAIIEKYNTKINDIEGELETARGDRRLFLLDQINQEVRAREVAYNEQVRLQKQEEENAKKQEKLREEQEKAEKKRRQAQKVTDISTSIAQTALAVVRTLGAYPPPASTVLAAMIGAMGAAQTAIIASTKYANGGVIDGPSHSQGGVKVMGGTAEVEGGEFITNKQTTSNNVDLLEYINSKRRKIQLGDLIDFYSGNSIRTSRTSSLKFANGGQLPSTQINPRAITTQQDNRPIYVSVQEIEDVQKRVRNVRVLAGVND